MFRLCFAGDHEETSSVSDAEADQVVMSVLLGLILCYLINIT